MKEARRQADWRARYRHGRQLTVLLSLCAALVVVASLEAIILLGPVAYQVWQEMFPAGSPGDFAAFLLTRFFFDILVPVSLALYSYFTIRRLGTPASYRLIWGAVVLMSAIWKFLTFETASPAWYLTLLLWIGLFLVVINIRRLERGTTEREDAHELSKDRR